VALLKDILDGHDTHILGADSSIAMANQRSQQRRSDFLIPIDAKSKMQSGRLSIPTSASDISPSCKSTLSKQLFWRYKNLNFHMTYLT
jgi:hypothetical protein